MIRFVGISCLLLTCSWSLIHAASPPSHGAIVQEGGELQLVEGMLLAHTTLSIQQYLEANTILIQNHMGKILPVIEKTKASLTAAHLATLRRGLHNSVFMYRQLLTHNSRSFLLKNLNITNLDEYSNNWMNRITSVTDISTLCTCPPPGCLPPCVRSPSIISNSNESLQVKFRAVAQAVNNSTVKTRSKRGWVDLGGVILNTVLGTATEEQVRQVNTTVSNLKLATYQLEIKSNHIIDMVGKSLGYITEIVTSLEDTSNKLDELSRYLILYQLITEISTVIKHLITVSLETETRIALLRKGVMPPILTDEQLITLIREGKRHFPDLDFPFSYRQILTSNSTQYTNVLKSVPTTDPHVFIVGIPFVSKRTIYELFKFTPFPIKNLKNQLVMPTLNKYIARSSTDFIVLQTLEKCDSVGSVYLCDNLTVRQTNISTCENAILANDLPLVNATCDYYQVELDKNYYAVPIGKSWYVYFDTKTHGTMRCPESRVNKVMVLEGLIQLQPPCSLQTSQITFTTVETAAINITQLPTLKIPLTPIDVIPVVLSSSDQSLLTNINNDLAQLKTIQKKTTILEADWSIQMPIIFSVSGLAFVLLALAVCTCVLLYYRRKKAAATYMDYPLEMVSPYLGGYPAARSPLRTSGSRSSMRSSVSVRPGILRPSSVPASVAGTL